MSASSLRMSLNSVVSPVSVYFSVFALRLAAEASIWWSSSLIERRALSASSSIFLNIRPADTSSPNARKVRSSAATAPPPSEGRRSLAESAYGAGNGRDDAHRDDSDRIAARDRAREATSTPDAAPWCAGPSRARGTRRRSGDHRGDGG